MLTSGFCVNSDLFLLGKGDFRGIFVTRYRFFKKVILIFYNFLYF